MHEFASSSTSDCADVNDGELKALSKAAAQRSVVNTLMAHTDRAAVRALMAELARLAAGPHDSHASAAASLHELLAQPLACALRHLEHVQPRPTPKLARCAAPPAD